jgi:DNA-binding transcriptional LysR family regulator
MTFIHAGQRGRGRVGRAEDYAFGGFGLTRNAALSLLSWPPVIYGQAAGTARNAGEEMTQGSGPEQPLGPATPAHHGVELRHLRYLVAVADAGTFTHAAERMFVTQPTLSHQIRQLEEMVGTPLLHRRPDGVRLTEAGSVLVEESRTVLALLEHGVSRCRQAAGLGRTRLRFALTPNLPEELALTTASRLRCLAAEVGADVTWLEAPLDSEFTLIRQRRADAGLGWLTTSREALPDTLEVMTLADFEPEVWIPAAAGDRDVIDLDELADMDVIHGPRRTSPGTYDVWQAALRTRRPRFEFTDPPFRYSLPMTLAFAAAAARPTAVLTGPLHLGRDQAAASDLRQRAANRHDMVRVGLSQRPLSATAIVAWSGDLPRSLQQVLFDAADTYF